MNIPFQGAFMKAIFCLLAAICLITPTIHADFKLSEHKTEVPKFSFPVEKYTLKNGLTVLLVQDRSIPMISFHTWFKVGSRNEQKGVTGAAHMLEHMMFKGAKKYSGKDFDRILHENGITNNAFTTNDFTGFYQNLPSGKLELMMDMESDRLRNLKLDPQDLKSELQVVGEERRWRVDNNPNGLLREILMATMFQVHPYTWPVIGWMKDIQAYTSEKLRFFYDQFYVPNNAILVIVGDIKISETKNLIEKYYGILPAKELPKQDFPKEPVRTNAVRKVTTGAVQAPSFIVGFPGVKAVDDDNYPLEVLATLLAGGNFSRLNKALVQNQKICTYVGAANQSGIDPGAFMFWVFMKPGMGTEAAEKVIQAEIENLKKNGVTQEELVRAKNQLMKYWIDSVKTIDGKAESLAEYEIVFGDYSKMFQFLERISAVTAEDVKNVANKYFDPKQQVTTIVVPKK
jgi:zinc protease